MAHKHAHTCHPSQQVDGLHTTFWERLCTRCIQRCAAGGFGGCAANFLSYYIRWRKGASSHGRRGCHHPLPSILFHVGPSQLSCSSHHHHNKTPTHTWHFWGACMDESAKSLWFGWSKGFRIHPHYLVVEPLSFGHPTPHRSESTDKTRRLLRCCACMHACILHMGSSTCRRNRPRVFQIALFKGFPNIPHIPTPLRDTHWAQIRQQ